MMQKTAPRIVFIDLRQDDPRRSTMRKLARFGMATVVSRIQICRSIVMNPFSAEVLTGCDSDIAVKSGIGVVEGSWKRIGNEGLPKCRFQRRLPLLVPVNPVNYGHVGLMSSAEAVAAALYITGFHEMAESVMGKFSWGKEFIGLNYPYLSGYIKCKDQKCIEEYERRYFNLP